MAGLATARSSDPSCQGAERRRRVRLHPRPPRGSMPAHPSPGRLEPETRAAYIDGRLSEAERAAVEAEIAADPENYEWLVNTIDALDAPAVEEELASASSPAPAPTPAPGPEPKGAAAEG